MIIDFPKNKVIERMRLMMPLAEGFEEIEAFSVVSVLRGAGINVDTVGVVGSVITGGHGVRVMVDKKLMEINVENYDGVVLPGGTRGCANLIKSKDVLDSIRDFNASGKLVAGICAAPKVLAEAGVLSNRKATIYPGMEKEIAYPRGDRVVVDGNVITSQGPGTAIEFALSIIEYFLGREIADIHKMNLVV